MAPKIIIKFGVSLLGGGSFRAQSLPNGIDFCDSEMNILVHFRGSISLNPFLVPIRNVIGLHHIFGAII